MGILKDQPDAARHRLKALHRRHAGQGIAAGDRRTAPGHHLAAARDDRGEGPQPDSRRPVGNGQIDRPTDHCGGCLPASAAHVLRQHRHRHQPALGTGMGGLNGPDAARGTGAKPLDPLLPAGQLGRVETTQRRVRAKDILRLGVMDQEGKAAGLRYGNGVAGTDLCDRQRCRMCGGHSGVHRQVRTPGGHQMAHQRGGITPGQKRADRVQRGDGAVDLGPPRHQRRLQAQHMRGVEQGCSQKSLHVQQVRADQRRKAAIQAGKGQRGRMGLRRKTVELQPLHEATPAHCADHVRPGVLQRLKPGAQIGPIGGDTADQGAVIGQKQIQCRQTRRAGQRVVGEGRAVQPPKTVVPGRRAHDTGTDGHQPAAQRLGQKQHVGWGGTVRTGKQRAGAAQPGLNLVKDRQHAKLAAQGDNAIEIPFGRADDATLALNWLYDEGGDLTGARLQPGAECRQIPERHIVKSGCRGAEILLIHGFAGRRQRTQRLAVKAVPGRQDDVAARAHPCQLDGGLHRLGPAVGKGDDAQIARRHLGKPLCQPLCRDGSQGLHHDRNLILLRAPKGRPDLGRVMPEGQRAILRQKVKIGPARRIEHLRSDPFDHRCIQGKSFQQLGTSRIQGMHVGAPLHFVI